MRGIPGIILLITILSCEERIDLPISAAEMDIVAVEGVITNERMNHVVKLTRPYKKINGIAAPLSGATVYIIEDTTKLYPLTEYPQGSGHYYTPMIRGLSGRVYTLYVLSRGKAYFARDSSRPVQPLTPLAYEETENGNVLRLNPQGEDANYVEHFITWDQTGWCLEQDICKGRIIYYDLKTIDVNEMFKPEMETFYFPDKSIVVRRKYSVSPAYKAFLRSMLSETEWRGGGFDIQRANVPTNLSEGATGFFAVCTVVSDTTVVE